MSRKEHFWPCTSQLNLANWMLEHRPFGLIKLFRNETRACLKFDIKARRNFSDTARSRRFRAKSCRRLSPRIAIRERSSQQSRFSVLKAESSRFLASSAFGNCTEKLAHNHRSPPSNQKDAN